MRLQSRGWPGPQSHEGSTGGRGSASNVTPQHSYCLEASVPGPGDLPVGLLERPHAMQLACLRATLEECAGR